MSNLINWQVDGTCSSTGVVSVGSVTITLTTSDGPSNDNFAVAYIIPAGQQAPTMTTAGSTSEAGEPGTNGRSVWYRWVHQCQVHIFLYGLDMTTHISPCLHVAHDMVVPPLSGVLVALP